MRIVVTLVAIGGFAYGLIWFVESSRLSDRVNELIIQTEQQVYRPMLEGSPTVNEWLEQAPVLWQPLIHANRDLIGTSAEDAYFLTLDMRNAVVDCMRELRAFEVRSFRVLQLLNSHPESMLGQMRYGGIPNEWTTGGLDLESDIQIDDEEAMARLFAAPVYIGRDIYTWDNDLALFQAIRQGHGPTLLERIAELSEETPSLADNAREMSRLVHSKIAQSGLPEGQRRRMLSDWNNFASAVGGMVIPYEQNGRQLFEAYAQYVEYLMEDFAAEELRPGMLRELDPVRTDNLSQLRQRIEMAGF